MQILLSQMEDTQLKRLINHLKGAQFKQREGPVQPEREGLPETEVPNFIYTYLAAAMMSKSFYKETIYLFVFKLYNSLWTAVGKITMAPRLTGVD